MVVAPIPNLVLAYSEPGNSEPTKMGEYVVAKSFESFFAFKDGDKKWFVKFGVTISDLGTPKLNEVSIYGSRLPHPSPLRTESPFASHAEFMEILGGTKEIFTRDQLKNWEKLLPEAESIQRWQIKVIEQYRFQLLELGIQLAIQRGKPTILEHSTGKNRYWLEQKPLDTSEIKKLQKIIDKKLRQKITPELLKKVSEIYTEAGLRNEKPVKAVQEFYKCAYRTAQDYVSYARAQNFLPPTTPGKVTVRKLKKERGKHEQKPSKKRRSF